MDLERFDEPVRRYLAHALGDGGSPPTAMRLTMAGRIDAGRWLDFTAEQDFRGRGFEWRCRAGWRHVKPFHVVDRYADGAGSTEARLFGLVPFLRSRGEDTTRAAAGRAAAESVWVPGTLLAADWRAEAEDRIVARLDVPPEQPELTLTIDAAGAVQRVSLMRWGNVGRPDYGYIPFGAEVRAERRFGDLTLPSELTVGWWFGTPAVQAVLRGHRARGATAVAAQPPVTKSAPIASATASAASAAPSRLRWTPSASRTSVSRPSISIASRNRPPGVKSSSMASTRTCAR